MSMCCEDSVLYQCSDRHGIGAARLPAENCRDHSPDSPVPNKRDLQVFWVDRNDEFRWGRARLIYFCLLIRGAGTPVGC